jgi:methionyl-tRNA formyltransferase
MKKGLTQNSRIAFFGTPVFAVTILNELEKAGIIPTLIVTAPDKPKGRGLVLTAPPVKEWAQAHEVTYIQPQSLRHDDIEKDILINSEWDLCIVAAYGKILPKEILDLPSAGTLNVHPSLLPKFRGASPIESQILADEKEVGVTIMLMDEELDHGPIVAQARIVPEEWPLHASDLEELLATEGGALLAETIPLWLSDADNMHSDRAMDGIEPALKPEPQAHSLATFTKKITKEDGKIELSGGAYQNYLKFCAYEGWPGIYYFKDGKRIKIVSAVYVDGVFTPTRIIPEGKAERDYDPK